MHKSWGNAIWFDDAVEKMGADVMRWMYAEPDTGPEPELRLRAGRTRSSGGCSRCGTATRSSSPTRGSTASGRRTRCSTRGPQGDGCSRSTAGCWRATQQRSRGVPRRARRVRLAAAWRARSRRSGRRSLELVRPLLPRRASGRARTTPASGRRSTRCGTRWCSEPRRGAGDAVPGRRAVAEPGARRVRRRAGLRAPLGLPGRAPDAGGRRAGRRDGQRAHRRRAGPPRPGRGVGQPAPAARLARRRDRRSGAAREDRAPRRADRGRARRSRRCARRRRRRSSPRRR